MAFGIQDLERDVQKFKEDIENAKAKYMDEYAEYLNIATDFENVEQKDDFLQQEVELVTTVFPEERRSNLSVAASSIFAFSGAFDIASGISFIIKVRNKKKLITALQKVGVSDDVIKKASGSVTKFVNLAKSSNIGEAAKIARFSRAANVARVTFAAGMILVVVGGALEITSAVKRKKYLKEQKGELEKHLDEFNSVIAEANDNTKNVINAFLTYFDELGIDVDGVFNDNQDGFLDESGQQKFDDSENGVVSQLREALNGAIRRMGELNAAIRLANRRIDRYISQGLEGTELIEEVVFDTELPEEFIQRLYVFKLRELGSNVQEAEDLSGLPGDLVKELYARGYLDDGKTVEQTVELSGLTEDRVRRVYASKLLDDALNAENPDDVLDLRNIAEQAGIAEEIVREIRAQKIADLQSSSEEEDERLNAANPNDVLDR